MKKLLVISLVFVAMMASTVGYSNGHAFISNDTSENVTSVTFEKVEKGSVIELKDRNKTILYSETIQESGTYVKGFDLTNLPDGAYYFEVESKSAIKVIPFKVAMSTVEFLEDEERSIDKPEVLFKDGYVYISKNAPDNKSVDIEVYYEGYDLAYSERIRKGQKVNRIYDFSSSKKGNYFIVMKSEGRTFTNKVMI